jgi:hypothetical protein
MTQEYDTYWQEDVGLFTGIFPYYRNKPKQVRAKIHMSREQYDCGQMEIVPIEPHRGERVYVMLHPYVEEPNIILTVGLHPPKHYADGGTTIGKVQGATVQGFRQIQVGNCQAWYYINSKILILWECFLERVFTGTSSPTIPAMTDLWQSVEKHLQAKFPKAERIVTPLSEPLFETTAYQAFLRSRGFEPVAPAAYGKLF